MTETKCRCGKPTSGAYLCDGERGCIKTLEVAFANVSAYHADLETLRTKRTRYGSGTATKGSIGKAQPIGVDLRFVRYSEGVKRGGDQVPGIEGNGSEIDHDTRNTVVSWARTVMDEQPELHGPYCKHACLHVSCAAIFRRRFPRDTVQSMCAYLQRQLRWIVAERFAVDILDEFLDIERRLASLVDRPADRWYAGKCSADLGDNQICPAELYAHADRGTIKCRACEAEYDVATRRDFLLREAQEFYVTATEAAGALLAWTDYDGSETKLIDRIRKWDARKQLEPRGHIEHLGRDRTLYRLGDIQAMLLDDARHAQRRRIGVGGAA